MARYFFHTLDGQRCIDREGTLFDSLEDAKTEAIKRGCRWVNDTPSLLLVNQDCRVEVTGEARTVLFTVMMFAVDNQVWRGRSRSPAITGTSGAWQEGAVRV